MLQNLDVVMVWYNLTLWISLPLWLMVTGSKERRFCHRMNFRVCNTQRTAIEHSLVWRNIQDIHVSTISLCSEMLMYMYDFLQPSQLNGCLAMEVHVGPTLECPKTQEKK